MIIDISVRELIQLVLGRCPGRSSVEISVPRISNKEGTYTMPGTVNLPNDAMVTLNLVFRDEVTNAIHAPPSGGSVSVSDDTVASAAISDDDTQLIVTALADGSATVNYVNGPASDTITVNVQDPTATTVAIDVDHPIFAPKP